MSLAKQAFALSFGRRLYWALRTSLRCAVWVVAPSRASDVTAGWVVKPGLRITQTGGVVVSIEPEDETSD